MCLLANILVSSFSVSFLRYASAFERRAYIPNRKSSWKKMEKTRPKASFCFKGTTADHKIEEKSNDNNQKKALKIKQKKYIHGWCS